jgi:hypothetical protein
MVLSIIFHENKHKMLLHLSTLYEYQQFFQHIDKCYTILCLSSRNMIDKTMCEVLWRNISDFYVNLRVEVAAVSRNRYGVEKQNTSLKLPVGVSPFQVVNLHRNRRYFVIKLHTWFCLSYFLKTNITFYCISGGCIEKQIRCLKNCWYS